MLIYCQLDLEENRSVSWWRHQIETFSALLALCAGNSPVTGEFPAQKPMTRSLMFSLICAWINTREAGDLNIHSFEYTPVRLVIWDAIATIMTSCNGNVHQNQIFVYVCVCYWSLQMNGNILVKTFLEYQYILKTLFGFVDMNINV